MTSQLTTKDLESLPIPKRKELVRELVNAESPGGSTQLEPLYHEAIQQLPALSLETLEALSGPSPNHFPPESQALFESFREELDQHLRGTFNHEPRKLHALLYRMGLPSDVGCG